MDELSKYADLYKTELLDSVVPFLLNHSKDEEYGSFSDSFEGRFFNPEHTNEAIWFMMDLAVRFNNKNIIEKCVSILLQTTENGWDQNLLWMHIETLVAMAQAYKLTGNAECKTWFEKIHEYSWSHFKHIEYPEWYGYLNRRGEPLLDLNGGKWKGCLNVPRGLYEIGKNFD